MDQTDSSTTQQTRNLSPLRHAARSDSIDLNHVSRASTPPTFTINDYAAASIFWIYILGALYFSFVALHTIARLPQIGKARSRKQKRELSTLTICAGISFTVLSVNMLNILIQSFITWNAAAAAWSNNAQWIHNVWTWSLQTKPFVQFIVDISADRLASTWSLAALLATFVLHMYISIEGKRYGIPKLWAFFGLAQILPISFASTLFFIAILRSPPPRAVVSLPIYKWLIPATAFYACLELAGIGILPSMYTLANDVRGQTWIVPLVVLARLLLLAAPAMVKQANSSSQAHLGRAFSPKVLCFCITTLATGMLALQLQEGPIVTSLKTSLEVFRNPAVSTLGCDFLLLVTVSIIWAFVVEHPE